jgi:hypothetical protein
MVVEALIGFDLISNIGALNRRRIVTERQIQ